MKVLKHHSLKAYNTFGMDVKAAFFCEINTIEALTKALQEHATLPLLILGGGSNLLLTKDFPGLVLKINLKGKKLIEKIENDFILEIGAGENWHELVLWSLEHAYNGLENLSLIPGNAGTAPMQNIGAYGVEIKDVFESLTAYHIASGEIHHFSKEACEFGYRESVFKNRLKGEYIILSIRLRLHSSTEVRTSYGAIQSELQNMGIDTPTPSDVSKAVIRIRQSKLPDPKKIGNSGSFFKNPVISRAQFEKLKISYPEIVAYPVNDEQVKLAAGWLIEKAGWKGYRKDNYGVHKNQALVLVNYSDAKGSDIAALSEEIQQSVKEKFGVSLHAEVNII